MAGEKALLYTELRLEFDGGMNEKGNPIVKRKGYGKLNPEATPDNILAVAYAISDLASMPLIAIRQIDTADIREI